MSVAERTQLLAGLTDGDTLVFTTGTYTVDDAPMVVAASGVTLRSASGDPNDVVITGSGVGGTLLEIRASDVRLAGVTLAGSTSAAVRLGSSDGSIRGITIDHVSIRDNARYGVRASVQENGASNFVDDVKISCSTFSLSSAYRDRLDEAAGCGNQNAISANASQGWEIRDNLFFGYFCQDTEARATVSVTDGSRDTIFERNVMTSVFRGLLLGGLDPSPEDADGNPLPPPTETRAYPDNPCESGVYWGHIGGVVRNNMFWNGADDIVGSHLNPSNGNRIDSMISFWRTCGGTAAHNTIIGLIPPASVFAGIEYRFEGTEVDVFNNLSTYDQKPRNGGIALGDNGNLFDVPANVVVGPVEGDLHLAEDSIARNVGLPLADVADDFDGDARDQTPDAGADEFVAR